MSLVLLLAAPAAAMAAGDPFAPIYQILQHPRCSNCHTDGDAPLRRDNQAHVPAVKRGPEGKGTSASACTNCHKDKNTALAPGAPNWRMPPPGQMVFRARSEGALCRQLSDPKQNGNRDAAALGKHFQDNELIGWAWNAGAGRKPPPIARAELVGAVAAWLQAGMPCPAE